MFHQAVSLIGALLILIAYGLNLRGVIGPTDRTYNVMNLVGAGLLTWIAIEDQRAGFILLEGTWTLMSAIPLIRRRAATK